MLETTVADLLMLGSVLHLALRNPLMPRRVRGQVETFLELLACAVEARDPILGEVARLGADPAYDVEAGRCPRP